jgi:FAD/FMN-containing dehydrogenase
MQPYYIAYPEDINDIKIMIDLARLLGKKIVARSGGHQYSGLSSGGDDTIVLSLDAFN